MRTRKVVMSILLGVLLIAGLTPQANAVCSSSWCAECYIRPWNGTDGCQLVFADAWCGCVFQDSGNCVAVGLCNWIAFEPW